MESSGRQSSFEQRGQISFTHILDLSRQIDQNSNMILIEKECFRRKKKMSVSSWSRVKLLWEHTCSSQRQLSLDNRIFKQLREEKESHCAEMWEDKEDEADSGRYLDILGNKIAFFLSFRWGRVSNKSSGLIFFSFSRTPVCARLLLRMCHLFARSHWTPKYRI